MLPVRRALISVSDKTGLEAFAQGLHRLGIEIVSTGGTARFLEEAGVPVVRVAEVTGFPEILDGRVKTLHPRIHGGILADRSRGSHLGELKEHGIAPIDLVAVNLYPFERTAAEEGATFSKVVEMIDIGGPSMVRGAAKNHQGVVVVVDPGDYGAVLAALEQEQGSVGGELRRGLAAKAFRHTRDYDTAIAAWLETQGADGPPATAQLELPEQMKIELVRELEPRYGENPHQRSAIYRTRTGPGLLGGLVQLQGKTLSWNNLLDADAARKMVGQFDGPAVAIVKHNNPCGVGLGRSQKAAYERALATDPTSAFGSIVAVNQVLDGATAKHLSSLFVEVVVAPGYEPAALERLAKKKRCRILLCPAFDASAAALDLRSVDGGLLVQELDAAPEDSSLWTVPTRRKPSAAERKALEFAWAVCRYVKSNAIVITNRNQTVGIGAGQMSRVDSCRLAIEKAQRPLEGTVAASDAFFPFRDGLDTLAAAGVKAVIQPGGSLRDEEVIAAADEQGLALIHTGRRHFRH
jgi:phosphoribosylaminoimidazolecarboxamide formyltransferase/IMP cyclohydrolase